MTVHHSSVADVDETEVETSDVENYADSMLASDGTCMNFVVSIIC